MQIKPFELERFFARHEFSSPYLLCCSDCEAFTIDEVLSHADNGSLELWKNLKLSYTDSRGHPLLREEIKRLYTSITPRDVLVCTPEEGIFLSMHSILKHGDHVVTTFPGYQSLYEIAGSIGCTVDHWKPREENGWVFDIGDLERLLKKNTKLLVINFPHNPTGSILEQKNLRHIVDLVRRNNTMLFSDEMYRYLEYDETDTVTAACDLYENAISLFGMSKTFALPGLRIGWLVTRNSGVLEKIAAYKDYTTICSSAPSEILAIIALRTKDLLVDRNLALIVKNLNILDSFFNDHRTMFRWHRPKAGPIAFPGMQMGLDSTEFCSDLRTKMGVLLLPSENFNFGRNHFRIGFARKNMTEALGRLKEYLTPPARPQS
jgi:aspartate/methionine/tyrosine aminotransferase